MSQSKSKLMIVLIAFAILAMSSLACNIEPGDGQVGDAVMEGQGAIQDAVESAFEYDAVTDVETHESPLPALWDWAETIAQGE